MTNLRTNLSNAITLCIGLAIAAPLVGCRPTSHAAVPSSLGVARRTADLEAVIDEPGPVVVESIVSADWAVPRSGLINLDHPKAKEAKLTDGDEPVLVIMHALRHPTQGLYVVDTGIERALRVDPDHAALNGFAARYMGVDKMKIHIDTATWIAAQKEPVKGVFLTHLHLDHIAGMRDVPNDAIVFTGPGEAGETRFLNLFVKSMTNDALDGKGDIREWQFAPDADGAFAGVVDVFGDRTVWAIQVPGHTDGSTAYIARTPNGAVLFTGDASHTAWGWEHGVEPGTYSSDGPRCAESFARLRAFVAKHPKIDVRLGHQELATR